MLRVYTDGGSRGNPGPAAFAAVVCDGRKVLCEVSGFAGIETNNYAEYRGLIAGIAKAVELGATEAEFVTDSMLMARQMRGEYMVKSPKLADLHRDAKALASLIPRTTFRNVRRHEELIPRADALVNAELDRRMGRR